MKKIKKTPSPKVVATPPSAAEKRILKTLTSLDDRLHDLCVELDDIRISLKFHDSDVPKTMALWHEFILRTHTMVSNTHEANVRLMIQLMQSHEDTKKLTKVLLRRFNQPGHIVLNETEKKEYDEILQDARDYVAPEKTKVVRGSSSTYPDPLLVTTIE